MNWHPGWRDHVAAIYQHAPRGRLATVATLGNHDYGLAWEDPRNGREPRRRLAVRAASRCCAIEMVDAGGLQIVGLDELWAKRFNPQGVLRSLDAIARSDRAQSQSGHGRSPGLGQLSKAGFLPATRTAANASRRFFLRRCCRSRIGVTPPVNFNWQGTGSLYISRGVGTRHAGSIQRPSRGDALRVVLDYNL